MGKAIKTAWFVNSWSRIAHFYRKGRDYSACNRWKAGDVGDEVPVDSAIRRCKACERAASIVPREPVRVCDDALLIGLIRKEPGIQLAALCMRLDIPWANPAPVHGYSHQARRLQKQLRRLRDEGKLRMKAGGWWEA